MNNTYIDNEAIKKLDKNIIRGMDSAIMFYRAEMVKIIDVYDFQNTVALENIKRNRRLVYEHIIKMNKMAKKENTPFIKKMPGKQEIRAFMLEMMESLRDRTQKETRELIIKLKYDQPQDSN